MAGSGDRVRVSLVAVPEAMVSTLGGLYDVLGSLGTVASFGEALPDRSPFEVEIVAATRAPVALASGLPVEPQRAIGDITQTDVVIVPSLLVTDGVWHPGRHPQLVDWLKATHERGATLCSACSGVLLLAETGLLGGKEATIHWVYATTFQKTFREVRLRPERALIATGDGERLVMSGASTSWHDLVLYLIARHLGPAAAQAVARFFAFQWHQDGLAPYVVFDAPTDHGDAVIAGAQAWLAGHFSVGSPVEAMVRRSGLAERSFKRRFTRATGHAPIAYVQRLRVEEAKRQLERAAAPIDEISWRVGYEDPAFFRRLFKRLTGLTPGAYRRRFRIPPELSAGRDVADRPRPRPGSPALPP